MILELIDEESLKDVCTVVILSLWCVVRPTVCEHSLHIGDEQPLVTVVVSFQSLCHGLHVHRELDVVVVIWDCLSVHRVQERPGGLMVPAGIEDSLVNIV